MKFYHEGYLLTSLIIFDAGGGSAPPLFDGGHVTYEGIAAHREEFMGKSVEQIADMLKENGYEVRIRPSNRQNKGSTAMILEITNPSKERNIDQVQISPDGSKHHGNVPYVKISTSNEGLIKVIDGTRELLMIGMKFISKPTVIGLNTTKIQKNYVGLQFSFRRLSAMIFSITTGDETFFQHDVST